MRSKIVRMIRRRSLKWTARKGLAIVGEAMVGMAVGAMAVGSDGDWCARNRRTADQRAGHADRKDRGVEHRQAYGGGACD